MKLFWLLCAGLLLAGTVEAGGRDITTTECKVYDQNGHKINTSNIGQIISDYPEGGLIVQDNSNSCYQRMREAMRMMRLTVDAAYRGSIVTATPQPSPTPKEIWDATMKECVQ